MSGFAFGYFRCWEVTTVNKKRKKKKKKRTQVNNKLAKQMRMCACVCLLNGYSVSKVEFKLKSKLPLLTCCAALDGAWPIYVTCFKEYTAWTKLPNYIQVSPGIGTANATATATATANDTGIGQKKWPKC